MRIMLHPFQIRPPIRGRNPQSPLVAGGLFSNPPAAGGEVAPARIAGAIRRVPMADRTASVDFLHISRVDASAIGRGRKVELGAGQNGHRRRGGDCHYNCG